MFELLPITIFSLIMAGFSHAKSKYNKVLNNYDKKENIFYSIMSIAMILFVGLRTKYNDTFTYLETYNLLTPSSIPILSEIDWSIGANPLFNLVNWILKYIGFSDQDFLMFYAVITLGIYIWFIRKYTCNIWLSIFLMFATGTYTFTLAAIKQSVAVAFCLLATDRVLNKKYVKFIFWIVIAMLFHPYSLMYLVVPFMMYKPWSKKTYLSLAFFAFVGVSLQFMLGSIIDITSMMGETYSIQEFSGEGVNPFRLIVCAAPLILSFIMKNHLAKQESNEADNLMLNLTMINAEIMFVALFGTANYFARLANYFLIFQCLSIPWLFKYLEKNSKKTITLIAILCYLFFYYYSNIYSGFSKFDIEYDSISLFEYIKSII